MDYKQAKIRKYDMGDLSAYTFSKANFTIDDAVHDLDLSAIVPLGTNYVNLMVKISSTSSQMAVRFLTKGNTLLYNAFVIQTQVSNMDVMGFGEVFVSADRKISYSVSNATWNAIDVSVVSYVK